MEAKLINKTATKIVDKFATVYTQYENGLGTEDQLKKNACAQIAVLTRMREVEAVKVDHIIDNFVKVIKAEREELEKVVDTVCTDLYTLIQETND